MRPGSYEEWVGRYDTITASDREQLRREQQQLAHHPLFSILLPIYNPQLDWLRAAIGSVKRQTYSRWQLCLADDASTRAGVREFLVEQAKTDERIQLVFRETNGHISACSNSALALARGEWYGLLDQDDLLAEHALSLVAREVTAHPSAGIIYSDEDFLDASGARTNPFFKPDWNPELFLGQNYINHFGVYRSELLRAIGGFREEYEGSQDYDLLLRCIERLNAEQIRHIPRVLYHWRMVPGSLAEVRDAKPYAKDAARRALLEHVQRCGIAARVEPCPENVESHRVMYELPVPPPSVSIVIYGTDLAADVNAVRACTDYQALEIIDATTNGATMAEQINNAAAGATGTILVLLHAAVELTDRCWLDELVGQAARPEVGAVGGRLWNSNDTLHHGGYLLGVGGIAASAHEHLPRGHAGYFNRTFLQRNCSAVSAKCVATKLALFRELGGFDAAHLEHAYHDVDFCLRLREHGFQIVWTPYVNPVFRAHDSDAASAADEDYMRRRWESQLTNDAFYSPNLALEQPAFELAFPPRWPTPPIIEQQPSLPRSGPAADWRRAFRDRLRRWFPAARSNPADRRSD